MVRTKGGQSSKTIKKLAKLFAKKRTANKAVYKKNSPSTKKSAKKSPRLTASRARQGSGKVKPVQRHVVIRQPKAEPPAPELIKG